MDGPFAPSSPVSGDDYDPRCCSRPDLVNDAASDADTVCVNCGRTVDSTVFLLGIQRDGRNNLCSRTRVTKSGYKERYYYTERNSQLQGKDPDIPRSVFRRIQLAIFNRMYANGTVVLDKTIVQQAMADLGDKSIRRKYLERYPTIINRISGRDLPKFSHGVLRKTMAEFNAIVVAWKSSVKPPGRKHLPYYSFLMLKLLERAGYPEYAFWLPPLKTVSKVRRTGTWWRKICLFNGWYPSYCNDTRSVQERLDIILKAGNPTVVSSRPFFASLVADARRAVEYNGLDGVSRRRSYPVSSGTRVSNAEFISVSDMEDDDRISLDWGSDPEVEPEACEYEGTSFDTGFDVVPGWDGHDPWD